MDGQSVRSVKLPQAPSRPVVSLVRVDTFLSEGMARNAVGKQAGLLGLGELRQGHLSGLLDANTSQGFQHYAQANVEAVQRSIEELKREKILLSLNLPIILKMLLLILMMITEWQCVFH